MPPKSVWREIWFYDDFTVKIEIWECAALDKFVINGGRKLHGDVRISGAKNAALIAVSILALSDGEVAARLDAFRARQTEY